jgi:hypothetical protein
MRFTRVAVGHAPAPLFCAVDHVSTPGQAIASGPSPEAYSGPSTYPPLERIIGSLFTLAVSAWVEYHNIFEKDCVVLPNRATESF